MTICCAGARTEQSLQVLDEENAISDRLQRSAFVTYAAPLVGGFATGFALIVLLWHLV